MPSQAYFAPEVAVNIEPVTEPTLQSIEEPTKQKPSEIISSSEGDP